MINSTFVWKISSTAYAVNAGEKFTLVVFSYRISLCPRDLRSQADLMAGLLPLTLGGFTVTYPYPLRQVDH